MKISLWIANGCCLGMIAIASNPGYFKELFGIQFQNIVSALIITFMLILISATILTSMKKSS